MQEAFDQCRLYRNYLRDPSGLWRHIVLGPNGTDAGYWATGALVEPLDDCLDLVD